MVKRLKEKKPKQCQCVRCKAFRLSEPPPLGPGQAGNGKLNPLIEFLEAQARELADEWSMDGTSFEQDQHTRAAALNLYSAALHLRSLRSQHGT